MLRRLVAGLLLAALTSCADLEVHQARSSFRGMSQPDLLACAGVPDAKQPIDARRGLLQWTLEENTPTVAMTLPEDTSVSLGALGKCQMAVTLQDGVVVHVAFTDHTASVGGLYGACGPIITECLHYPARLPLLPGYDPMAIYDGSAK